MTGVYYNEWDERAAAFLRQLIKAGLIPDGEVDSRSICDVRPADLRGFDQCHFFAGLGGWAYAFRLAGVEAKKGYWSGSCPCQPLSLAGKRQGHADERHLWPAFHDLIAECRPSGVFGEQVAQKDGREWLAGVRADLEDTGYACGAADLPACSIGAPHIRYRNFWVAYAQGADRRGEQQAGGAGRGRGGSSGGGQPGPLADAELPGASRYGQHGGGEQTKARLRRGPADSSSDGPMAHANGGQSRDGELQSGGEHGQRPQDGGASGPMGNAEGAGLEIGERVTGNAGQDPGPSEGQGFEQDGGLGDTEGGGRGIGWYASQPWARRHSYRSVAIHCADGKWRRVPASETGDIEPLLFPLAHGISGRVGVLRAAGNAIVPEVAAQFIEAAEEAKYGE